MKKQKSLQTVEKTEPLEGAKKVTDASNNGTLQPIARRGSMLNQVERSTVLLMRENGKSIADIADAIGRNPKTISNFLKESAQECIAANALEYVQLHKTAATVAAAKGDASPAQWALERLEVVKPKAQGPDSKGFTVKIGVMLPGLGESAQLVVDADPLPQVTDSEGDS